MGFTETLTIAFVVCKLSGLLDIPWALILFPELVAAIFYVLVFAAVMWTHVPTKKKKWRN